MDQSTLTIGWIGTGVMGASMAGHLLKAGHRVRVHTRTRAKAEPLLAGGAAWSGSPIAAAEGADAVISMVGYPNDVREVYLGAQGVLKARATPKLVIDMTTSRPSLAVEIEAAATMAGVMALDAPVSGGDVGARNAALSIMVGGEASAVEMAMPIFRLLGKTIVHQGGAGSGQHTKMVNQILIASTMIGVCEGLLYSAKAGLDAMKVIESVGSGAAGSWSINTLGPRIVKGDFNPGFFVEHFLKDLGIALEEAERMGLTLPGLGLAKKLYEETRTQGHGRLGTQSLYLAMQRLNGV
jgi:3-hydroxyisobutyrate dehydrogenase